MLLVGARQLVAPAVLPGKSERCLIRERDAKYSLVEGQRDCPHFIIAVWRAKEAESTPEEIGDCSPVTLDEFLDWACFALRFRWRWRKDLGPLA